MSGTQAATFNYKYNTWKPRTEYMYTRTRVLLVEIVNLEIYEKTLYSINFSTLYEWFMLYDGIF